MLATRHSSKRIPAIESIELDQARPSPGCIAVIRSVFSSGRQCIELQCPVVPRVTPPRREAPFVVGLDHFNAINDAHGHRLGDQALIALVEALRAHVSAGEVVARFGSDEFMMLQPGCDHDGATTRMQATIRALREVRMG